MTDRPEQSFEVRAKPRRFARPEAGLDVARFAFWFIFAASLANLAFNIASRKAGLGYPQSTYLGPPADLFADFFKYALTYPGGETVRFSDAFGLHDLLTRYIGSNDYDRTDVLLQPGGLAFAGASHYWSPPLTTLFFLLVVQGMRLADPVGLFAVLSFLLLVYTSHISILVGKCQIERIIWFGALVVNYPMLFMFNRGNLPDGVTALLIIHSLLLAMAGRSPILASVLLAVAFNIRPNAVPFGLPLLIFLWPHRMKVLVTLGTATATIFFMSYWAAHGLYSKYTLDSFRLGLASYTRHYVVGDMGLAGGSALYGALKYAMGVSAAQALAICIAAFVGLSTLVLWPLKRIGRTELLFLVCAAYTLGSFVIGDYHLLVFAIVPMAAATEKLSGWRWLATVLTACVLLSPKNVIFVGDLSYQVLINPIILTVAALSCIGIAAARPRLLDIVAIPEVRRDG